jgi:hypothetical protein
MWVRCQFDSAYLIKPSRAQECERLPSLKIWGSHNALIEWLNADRKGNDTVLRA